VSDSLTIHELLSVKAATVITQSALEL